MVRFEHKIILSHISKKTCNFKVENDKRYIFHNIILMLIFKNFYLIEAQTNEIKTHVKINTDIIMIRLLNRKINTRSKLTHYQCQGYNELRYTFYACLVSTV